MRSFRLYRSPRSARRVASPEPDSQFERASARCRLVPLRHADRQDFLASIDDVVLDAQGFDHRTLRRFRWRFWMMCAERHQGLPTRLAVRSTETGAFLGYYGVATRQPVPSLGWWLTAEARGHGLGTESLALALEYAHLDLGLGVVEMGTNPANTRAMAQITRLAGPPIRASDYVAPNKEILPSVWFVHAG